MEGKKNNFGKVIVALCLVLSLFGCATNMVVEEEAMSSVSEGMRRVVFYWKGMAEMDTSDMWIWWDGKDGNGYLFEECAYGFMCSVDVPSSLSKVGFLVRTSCSDPGGSSWGTAVKDWGDDRFAILTGDITEIYLISGDGLQYSSSDGGKTLTPIRNFVLAGMEDFSTVRYNISPESSLIGLDGVRIKDSSGNYMEIENVPGDGTVILRDEMSIDGIYTIEIDGYGEKTIVPTGVFDSEKFIDNYTYDGDDLGAVINGEVTVFKVWAPTAQKVVLNLFTAGDGVEAYSSVEMTRQEKGVWSSIQKCGHGTYYTYSVTTALGTEEAVDPYAKAVGVNGEKAMVVDLSLTDPDGFDNDSYIDSIERYSDAVIWETHVRDFSIANEKSVYKGKYLAFTERGLTNSSGLPTGVDYLVDLGITHVQLLPVFDYHTVDETKSGDYNWGYDPENYNAPEGSYSTDPYHGEVRINEFKRMVQSLHDAGIGVVMDVVYNHTYSLSSSFNKIVPYYYYRYTSDGTASNGSGCGNETASNRKMYRKFMIDSLVYWASEYHIDGFRFDLMGIHDTETMQLIEEALHKINPKCLIYGEGWSGGTCAYDSYLLASQYNISKIKASKGAAGGIAVFNDAIRDGLKGSVFTSSGRGFISGAVTRDNANRVSFGIKGGKSTTGVSWSVKNDMVVNYMSAHDNNTLWDKLSLSAVTESREEKLRMNRMGAAVVMISGGMPFMLSGEEILRTKGGDSNSYRSTDSVNRIDWESITPSSDEEEMFKWYASLISMREKYSWLRKSDVSCTVWDNNSIFVTYRERGNIVGIAIANPTGEEFLGTLPEGEWKIILDGNHFVNESEIASKCVSVPARSVVVLTK